MKRISKLLMILVMFLSMVVFTNPRLVKAADAGLTFEDYNRYVVNKPYEELPYSVEMEVKLGSSVTGNAGTIFGNFDWVVNGSNAGVPRVFNIQIVDGVVNLKFTNKIFTTEDIYFSEVDIRTGNWVHLSVCFDKVNKQAHLYVDGELKSTKAVSDDLTDLIMETSFHIGGNNVTLNPHWFRGEMREVTVFSDLRSASEVKNDYQNGVSLTEGDLLAQYSFSSSDKHKDLADNSGNGYYARYEDTWYDNQEIALDYTHSFAVVGDTQMLNYWGNDGDMNTLYKWIVDNKEAHSIEHVLGLGDITETWDKDKKWSQEVANNPELAGQPNKYLREWERAQEAIFQMNGKVSYNIIRGNHDETKYLNQYFNQEVYTSQIDGFFDDTINTFYQIRKIGNIDYLFIGLDFGASNEELAWACEVVERFPNHKVIVTTHGYLDQEGNAMTDNYPHTPSTGVDFETDINTNNGEEIWEKFVCKYENIVLVMGGHINDEDVVYSQRFGNHGNVVTQVLIDFQDVDKALAQRGQQTAGIVTMLYFSADGTQVEVAAYSTIRNQYYKKYNHFTIDLDGSCNGEHNLVEKHNAYQHWNECECGYVSNPVYHVYNNYTLTSNGTKLYTCSCGVTKEASNTSDKVALDLQALLEGYYNTGSYIKNTNIYLDKSKVEEELASYFHANVGILDRTTYYDGDKLWMSTGSDYSGYGTSEDGHLTTFRVSLDGVMGSETVLSNLPGMEEYYVTLHDLILGQHTSAHTNYKTLNLNDGWTYAGGVYTNTNADVLEAFRLFTAPGWLGKNSSNSNYIDFAKATIQAVNGQLILKLWVSATEVEGKLLANTEVVDGYAVFSKAVISEYYYKGNVSASLRGEGTQDYPYIIERYADLLHFRDNADLYAGKHVRLVADIDLKGENFYIDTFAGNFDGYGHTISGLNINGDGLTTGLFRTLVKGGTIRNLTINGKVVGGPTTGGIVGESKGNVINCVNYAEVVGNTCVGGVVGKALEGGVSQCKNYGYIDSKVSGWSVGGVVGEAYVSVNYCENYGDVHGLTTHTGGVVGSACTGSNVNSCINHGAVSASGIVSTGKGAWGLGGIVGSTEVLVTDCENYGNITSDSTTGVGQVGGIAGKSYNGTIKNSVNKGNVIVAGGLVGGILGDGYETTTIEGCTNYGSVSGTSEIGGVAGRIQVGSIATSVNHGTVTGTGGAVGGIVGNVESGTVTNSTNEKTGTVSGGTWSVGGVVGHSAANITSCYNYASVTGTNGGVGGIAGELIVNKNLVIENSENHGAVVGKSNTGGIVGYQRNNTVKGSVNKGTVNGTNEIGGIAGSSNGTIDNCINDGNVTATSTHPGGIVGNTNGTVKSSTNNGAVKGSWGVAGISAMSEGGKFENCINNGAVSGTGQLGGIVGKANGNTITNCQNNGSVTGTSDSVGGIVGDQYDSEKIYLDLVISYCSNSGAIKGGNKTAGIAGALRKGSVTNCENTGTVTGTTRAAGLVGQTEWTSGNKVTISESINRGVINATSYLCGGLVGTADNLTMTNCDNHGAITSTGDNIGGLVGAVYASSSVANCNNYAKVTARSGAGGLVYACSGTLDSCTNTGDIYVTSATGTYNGIEVAEKASANQADGTETNCTTTGKVYVQGNLVG